MACKICNGSGMMGWEKPMGFPPDVGRTEIEIGLAQSRQEPQAAAKAVNR